jgi:hypothetical protein
MATMATFFRRTEVVRAGRQTEAPARTLRVEVNPYKLRALPNDDIYFFTKRMDNSRVVRQAAPKNKSECWHQIGAACLLAVLAGAVITPHISRTLAGYKLQSLKAEHQTLLVTRRVLETEEATLLSPAHLNKWAEGQLTSPGPGQVVHLEPHAASSLAMNIAPSLTNSTR